MEKESLEYKKEQAVSEPSDTMVALAQIYIELEKIDVTEGLSKKSVKGVLEQHIRSINLCCKYLSRKQSRLKGEAVFRLVIGSKGRVTGVHTDTSKKKNEQLNSTLFKSSRSCVSRRQKGEKA